MKKSKRKFTHDIVYREDKYLYLSNPVYRNHGGRYQKFFTRAIRIAERETRNSYKLGSKNHFHAIDNLDYYANLNEKTGIKDDRNLFQQSMDSRVKLNTVSMRPIPLSKFRLIQLYRSYIVTGQKDRDIERRKQKKVQLIMSHLKEKRWKKWVV